MASQDQPPPSAAELAKVGLCATCQHARRIVSAKGSSFWLCERARGDSAWRKYPVLPVVRCGGFEKAGPFRGQ